MIRVKVKGHLKSPLLELRPTQLLHPVNLHLKEAPVRELALERVRPVAPHLSHASWYWW